MTDEWIDYNPEPTPPTDEERESYAAWLERWTEADREGREKGWLATDGYDSDPHPLNPDERWRADIARWQNAKHVAEIAARARARKELQKRADAAAEAARQAVLRGDS